MGKVIPNQLSWVGFLTTISATTTLVPNQTEIAAGVVLTPLLIGLNASSQGNVVPTPALDTLFETSIIGTSQATFTADFYRDSVSGSDTAWNTLPRKTTGYMVIARFGGTGTGRIPVTGNVVEVWPIIVVSRTMANMANNTVQTFTVTCSVPQEPNEAATVT